MTNDTKASGSPPANAPIIPPARIEILLVGMNGDLRGKQVPLEGEKKIWDGSVRLPSSTQSLDIWGDDNDDITGLSLSVGDPDGVCIPDRRSLTVMPWAPEGSRQVLATMHEFDGTASFMDPRAILARMLKRFDYDDATADIAARTVYLVQIGYISMQPGETTAARMARVAGYVAIFTGRKPRRRELDRFFARRGFVMPEATAP